MRWAALLPFLLFASCGPGSGLPAHAHDKWANGGAIPEWVKHKCCNADEAHDLTVEMHLTVADVTSKTSHNEAVEYTYYSVKGFDNAVPSMHVYPSQDGHIWAFVSPAGAPHGLIWCLFVPCGPKNEDAPADFGGECS